MDVDGQAEGSGIRYFPRAPATNGFAYQHDRHPSRAAAKAAGRMNGQRLPLSSLVQVTLPGQGARPAITTAMRKASGSPRNPRRFRALIRKAVCRGGDPYHRNRFRSQPEAAAAPKFFETVHTD